LGNVETTRQNTQRTFARANLLLICYGETGVMDFGLYCTLMARFSSAEKPLASVLQQKYSPGVKTYIFSLLTSGKDIVQ